MPSKYDSVLPGLPALPVADQTYQDRVDKVKADAPASWSPADYGKEYMRLRKAKEDLEEQISLVNLHLEAITQLLVESQDAGAEGWGQYGASDTMLRLVTGDTLRVQPEPYAQVVDKDACREWAVKQGLERLLALPWTTINSHVKQRLMNGEPEPDGVKAYVRKKLVFTPMKAEKQSS
jgi:hypothetical protein